MNFLTDIQKAMIQQVCESLTPVGKVSDEVLVRESKSLSEFFYGNEQNAELVRNYMQELGYVPASSSDDDCSIVLQNPDAKLPSILESKTNACDIRCYYGDDKSVFELVHHLDVIKVSANKLNAQTHLLFPKKQIFYVSSLADIDKRIDAVIDDNKIGNIKTGPTYQINWSCFYNIEIYAEYNRSQIIDFHRTK